MLGASGHTGSRVVDALKRRGADVRALTRKDADASQKASVRQAIQGADAVVNLAGPFLRNGLAPVEAAIEARVPYVDTTGEQAFMAQVRERLHGAAQEARVPIVNALAFEYAFGDLAAKRHFPKGGDALHVLYRPRSTAPSAGTKKSMLRVFAAPTLSYEEGKLRSISYGRYQKSFPTAEGPRSGAAFAGGEVLTVPRHTPFRTVRTYYQTKPSTARAARVLGPLARVALRGPVLRFADRRVDAKHQPPANAKARGEVHLVAEPSGEHIVIETPDPYVATAEIAAEGALRLVGAARAGVLAPAEAFDAQEMFDAMRKTMPAFHVERFPSLSSK